MVQITEEQVIEDFYDKYGLIFTELLSDIKDDLNKRGIPILNKNDSEQTLHFINFILYNINLQDLYK